MHALLLQDWITINVATTVGAIAQKEQYWLNIDPFDDLVLYLQTSAVFTTLVQHPPQMNYETCPTDDSTSFGPVLPPFDMAAPEVRIDKALSLYATLPPGRFLRWRLTTPILSAFSVTFRIWVAAYSFRPLNQEAQRA